MRLKWKIGINRMKRRPKVHEEEVTDESLLYILSKEIEAGIHLQQQQQIDPFEKYINKLRFHLVSPKKKFQEKFFKGYEILLKELDNSTEVE